MSSIESWEQLRSWNQLLYVEPSLGADFFWDEFKIKSAPKFREHCYSHIPVSWKDEVQALIKNIREKFGDSVEFHQVKEKFIELVIYFSVKNKDEKIYEEVRSMIRVTQESLRKKGVHV